MFHLGPTELIILICLSPVLVVGAVGAGFLYKKYLKWLWRR